MPNIDILPELTSVKAMRAIALTEANEKISLENIELSLPQCNDNELLIIVALR